MMRVVISATLFAGLASALHPHSISKPSQVVPSTAKVKRLGNVATVRPRVIITTDFPPIDVIPVKACKPSDPKPRCSDPDDVQSMVRFLLYTNEMDVEGLIASAGSFANVANKQNILAMLDQYDLADETLQRHDPLYPTASQLRSITWQGMDGTIGTEAFADGKYRAIETLVGPAHDTEASDAIIRIVDKPDPRPVWILVWGGPREAAQAIWKVRATRSAENFQRFVAKLRLYIVGKQDYTADWLLNTFPDLLIIVSERNYMGQFWNMVGADEIVSNAAWMEEHIRRDHGPLGAAYPRSGWDPSVPGVWEGDTPSFLHILSGIRGVSDPEQPDQPGWGGQFVKPDPSRAHWIDHPSGPQAVYRWRRQVQADLAARTEWLRP